MQQTPQKKMQRTATHYSIIFLLLGSISCATHIYANTLNSSNQKALFLPVFIAEFALGQGNNRQAINTYEYLVEYYNLPNINERALDLALQFQDIQSALKIARLWVDNYPNDVPAMFYLAHLSLRANEYNLAAKTLDRILQIDSNADLEGILAGIYPESINDRLALLQALNQINKKENPSILVLIAGLEAQNGQFDTALKKVNLALRKRPHAASFIILKANLYFASDRANEAYKWLDRNSNNRHQKTPDVGLFEVQHLIRQNLTEQAAKKLDQLLKKWPNHEQLLFLAGITNIDLKDYQKAEKYLNKLKHSDQYQDQVNYYLAVNAERNQNFEQAIQLYKNVDGNFYTVARKSLVSIYFAQNNISDALRFLTQERVSHPHHASFLYQLQAQIMSKTGQTDQAISLLDEALQQLPEDAELIYAQVLLFDPHKDKERLDDALDKLLDIEPNSPTFLNAYAYTLAQQNRKLSLARKYAEQALAYAPQQASILDTLGYIAFLQNDYPVAIEVLHQAYTLSPTLSIGVRYARALYIQGNIEKFSELCKDLEQRYPNTLEVTQLKQLLIPELSSRIL